MKLLFLLPRLHRLKDHSISHSSKTRVESSFYPLCEYVSENKDSANRKEPIYTSLILSTRDHLQLVEKIKEEKRRQNSELLQDKPIYR